MKSRKSFTVLPLLLLIGLPGYGQQHQAQLKSDAYLLVAANTYRIGKTQFGHATVSVRRESEPGSEVAVQVATCQITAPVQGEKKEGTRQKETSCDAQWPIDSDSDEAMKDFDVEGSAGSESIGELSVKETFKYKEMHDALLKERASARASSHHKFPIKVEKK